MKALSSAHNETVQVLARLLSKSSERKKTGKLVLEGLHLCQVYFEHSGQFECVFVREDAEKHREIDAFLHLLPEGTPIFSLSGAALTKISSLTSAPELMAVVRREGVSFLQHSVQDVLLLERIQDAGNLGTLLRTAAASGFSRVFLSPHCVDVWSPKVLRAAMGAHFSLEIKENCDLLAILRGFQGKKLVTALTEDAENLYAHTLTEPILFVFGNEGAGVSEALLREAVAVKIPLAAGVESLNVAAAAAVCLFECVRQRARWTG